jgi:hypothetical protein
MPIGICSLPLAPVYGYKYLFLHINTCLWLYIPAHAPWYLLVPKIMDRVTAKVLLHQKKWDILD